MIKIGELYYRTPPVSNQTNSGHPQLILTVSEPGPNGNIIALVGTTQNTGQKDPSTHLIRSTDVEESEATDDHYFCTYDQLSVSADSLGSRLGTLSISKLKLILKSIAEQQTKSYFQAIHKPTLKNDLSNIPYAGRVFDEHELVSGVSSMLDFWLTLGPEGSRFEKDLATFLKVRSSLLVNSGSSANLLALAALTSHKLKERRIKKGDEVITVAAGFPTTVAPIIQNGAIPVFCDVDPLTANIRVDQLEDAYVEGKTKSVMLAHALGNPFDLNEVKRFCEEKNLWLIEDNCDALGSVYDQQLTGSFGDLSTQSFYPPHHITLGEGGAVNITKEALLKLLVESYRDWGRDCWCPSGKDNTCKKRFDQQLGNLPHGYDHKYIYSHLGYNLKPLDIQAAIGLEQLKKLPDFVKARVNNWNHLRSNLSSMEDTLDFMLPTHAKSWSQEGYTWESNKPVVQPSWFAFMVLVKENPYFTRMELVRRLDEANIGNRMFFGGNMTKQPAFVELEKMTKLDGHTMPFRVIGDLKGADRIMNESVFVGTYPGLSTQQLDQISKVIKESRGD